LILIVVVVKGTDGYVQYKCSKEEEPFTFSWINSWWGTRKMSSSCPPKYKCIETGLISIDMKRNYFLLCHLSHDQLFTMSGTMNNFAEMHWVVTYNEKYLKSSPIESCHKITSNAEQQLSASEKNSTHTPQIIPRDITSEWQNELVKAQRYKHTITHHLTLLVNEFIQTGRYHNRSVTVTIENKTKWVLKRRDQWITQGVWALFPAETIPPNQSTTFATMSHGIVGSFFVQSINQSINQASKQASNYSVLPSSISLSHSLLLFLLVIEFIIISFQVG
jgi:uncharacterized membrane protein YeaQ/YmgE (transglycosylase-associated protein family)